MNSVNPNEFIPTRQSLLSRLKDWDNQDSWREFFNTYWRLIYEFAVKAGLKDAEAQDVVQETVLSVANQMQGFQYDPACGSFKAWLMQITRRRVADHLRKRYRSEAPGAVELENPSIAAALSEMSDGSGGILEEIWEEEWRRHLTAAATDRVKRLVSPQQYQMFEFSVLQHWPAGKVAEALGVSLVQVYMARHRVGKLFKREVQRLEKKMI